MGLVWFYYLKRKQSLVKRPSSVLLQRMMLIHVRRGFKVVSRLINETRFSPETQQASTKITKVWGLVGTEIDWRVPHDVRPRCQDDNNNNMYSS
jgi:hypothetical protein